MQEIVRAEKVKPVRKYYKILEIIAGLNLIYAVLCLFISVLISELFIIGPTVIAIIVIYYSFVGVNKWHWPKDFYFYSLIFGSIVAIMIHIGLILLYALNV